MGREAWWATVHGVAKSWPQLIDFTLTHSLTTLYAVQAQRRTHTRLGVKKVTVQGRFPGAGDIKATFSRMSRS